jgi:hypothetical protein
MRSVPALCLALLTGTGTLRFFHGVTMHLPQLVLLILGSVLGVAAGVGVAVIPELLECLATLTGTDSWPGEL